MKQTVILILFFLTAYAAEEATLKQKAYVHCMEIAPAEVVDNSFSPEKLQSYILSKDIKHPHIVYAQALVETGWFTSKIFKENYNLFGMREAKKRETTALGTRYKHAYYSDWKASVDDYLLWQQMFKVTPIETEKDYFKLLGARYAEDKRYVSVLKIVLKQDTTQWYKPPTLKSSNQLLARVK